MKRRIFIVTLLCILISIVGVTYAFFSNSTEFNNKFKTSVYDVQLEEEFYNDWGTKKVYIVNNDSTPIALRISYNELWYLCDNKKIIQSSGLFRLNTQDEEEYIEEVECAASDWINLNNKITGKEVANKEWTDSWENDFIFGYDGWYYYRKILNGNTNIQILNGVKKNEEIFTIDGFLQESYISYNEYVSANYELDFNYEAVQADSKAIKELWGHDVTINNDEISWNFN